MATIDAIRRDQTRTSLSPADLDALRARLRGTCCSPGDDAYDRVRSVWNGMIDRRPALIVSCRGTADVVAGLGFAREHGLRLAVKSVGHNIGGIGLCPGGLTLDLAPMDAVMVDATTRRVRVQPGANLAALDRETQLHGLAVPAGIVSTTGVAGLTLGGGFGWLTRAHGFTSDRLVSLDLVTADGRVVRASADENPDLFWALRGGGALGVVTAFEYEAVELGPTVRAGMVLHPMEAAPEVGRFFREFTEAASDRVTALMGLRKAPAAPTLPEALHGRPVALLATMYAGPADEGVEPLRPVETFGSPLAGAIAHKPFLAHQTMLDGGQPPGRRYYWKSEYVDRVDDRLIEVLHEWARRIGSPHSAILVFQLGGRGARNGVDAGPVGHRDARYIVNIAGSWTDPADDDAEVAWVRGCWEAVRPFSRGGGYVNFLTEDEGADRVQDAYDPEAWARLEAVRATWDPEGIFRRAT